MTNKNVKTPAATVKSKHKKRLTGVQSSADKAASELKKTTFCNSGALKLATLPKFRFTVDCLKATILWLYQTEQGRNVIMRKQYTAAMGESLVVSSYLRNFLPNGLVEKKEFVDRETYLYITGFVIDILRSVPKTLSVSTALAKCNLNSILLTALRLKLETFGITENHRLAQFTWLSELNALICSDVDQATFYVIVDTLFAADAKRVEFDNINYHVAKSLKHGTYLRTLLTHRIRESSRLKTACIVDKVNTLDKKATGVSGSETPDENPFKQPYRAIGDKFAPM